MSGREVFMFEFTVALHIVLCILVVLIILLQPGKGGDVGAAFGGGGGGGMFGPRGPASLLSRATTGVAIMFMVTSIVLALYSNDQVMGNSNLDELLGLEEGVEGSLKFEDDTDEAGATPDEEGADATPIDAAPAEDGTPAEDAVPADDAAPSEAPPVELAPGEEIVIGGEGSE